MVVITGLMAEGLSRPASCQSCTITTDNRRGLDLTGHGHDDEIGPLGVVGLGADHHRWALLGGGLIGKRKRHQDDIAELKGRHRRHRPGYPTP